MRRCHGRCPGLSSRRLGRRYCWLWWRLKLRRCLYSGCGRGRLLVRVSELLQPARDGEPLVLERNLQRGHALGVLDAHVHADLREPLDDRNDTAHRCVVHGRVALGRRARIEHRRVCGEQRLRIRDLPLLAGAQECLALVGDLCHEPRARRGRRGANSFTPFSQSDSHWTCRQ